MQGRVPLYSVSFSPVKFEQLIFKDFRVLPQSWRIRKNSVSVNLEHPSKFNSSRQDKQSSFPSARVSPVICVSLIFRDFKALLHS